MKFLPYSLAHFRFPSPPHPRRLGTRPSLVLCNRSSAHEAECLANTPSDSVDVMTRKRARSSAAFVGSIGEPRPAPRRPGVVGGQSRVRLSQRHRHYLDRTYRACRYFMILICEPKPPALINRSALPLPTTKAYVALSSENKIAILMYAPQGETASEYPKTPSHCGA